MLQKPNVLIFDEPTNHLDMEAIEELAKALENYEGTLLLVSHNRYFVSRLAKGSLKFPIKGLKISKGAILNTWRNSRTTISPPNSSSANAIPMKQGASKPSSGTNYTDHKRMKSQLAQMKKKAAQAEEKCHQLEQKIGEIDQRMASEGFYQKTPREEQQSLVAQKLQLEEQLMQAMEHWEMASLELIKCEE